MLFDRNKALLLFVLFLCTGVLLIDVATLVKTEKPMKPYSTRVSGIIQLDKIRYSGARYVNIVEKNLFTSTARPVLTDVTSVPVPTTSSGFNYTVNGIIVSPANKVVLLTDIRNNQSHLVVEGDRLDDWQVAVISNKNVIFSKNDGSKQVLKINDNDDK